MTPHVALSRPPLTPTPHLSRLDSSLFLAAENGDLAILLDVLHQGAHPCQISSDGYTALHLSAENGHGPCVQALLPVSSPNARASASLYTALHLAALNGHFQCCSLLMPSSNPLLSDADGWTALHCAAQSGNADLCRLLVPFGGYVLHDNFGWTPLHIAAQNGSISCLEVLLPVSPLHDRTDELETALQLAQKYAHTACSTLIERFIQAGEEKALLTQVTRPAFSSARNPQL